MSGIAVPPARDPDWFIGRSGNVGTTGIMPAIERGGSSTVVSTTPNITHRGYSPDPVVITTPTAGTLTTGDVQAVPNGASGAYRAWATAQLGGSPPPGLLTIFISDGSTGGYFPAATHEVAVGVTTSALLLLTSGVAAHASATFTPDMGGSLSGVTLTMTTRAVKER